MRDDGKKSAKLLLRTVLKMVRYSQRSAYQTLDIYSGLVLLWYCQVFVFPVRCRTSFNGRKSMCVCVYVCGLRCAPVSVSASVFTYFIRVQYPLRPHYFSFVGVGISALSCARKCTDTQTHDTLSPSSLPPPMHDFNFTFKPFHTWTRKTTATPATMMAPMKR